MPKPPKRMSRRELKKKKRGLSLGDKAFIGMLFLVVIVVVVAVMQPSQPQNTSTTTTTSSLPFTTAPDFTLPVVSSNGLTGNQASLSYFRGKVILLEFMYSWCVHCLNMLPTLEKLHSQYGSAIFISVAGTQQSSLNDVAQFIKQHGGSWIYVFDKDNTVFQMYQVSSTPTFFIINGDGSVVNTYSGEQSFDTLSKVFQGLGVYTVMPVVAEIFTHPRKP